MLVSVCGDLLLARADALVNPVNCVGVMGRGLALQFRRAYPDNFQAYAAACRRGGVVPGRVFVFSPGSSAGPRYIVNFPTKRHWREKSRLEDIAAGLDDLVRVVLELAIRSIAIPPLGCGLGGLDWPTVRGLVAERLGPLHEVRVLLYEPCGSGDRRGGCGAGQRTGVRGGTAGRAMSPGRAALVVLADRFSRGGNGLALPDLHALMYMLQAAGERLRLKFGMTQSGLLSDNLPLVLREMEGVWLCGASVAAAEPDGPVRLLPGALAEAERVLAGCPETRERIERVCRMVELAGGHDAARLAEEHWRAAR